MVEFSMSPLLRSMSIAFLLTLISAPLTAEETSAGPAQTPAVSGIEADEQPQSSSAAGKISIKGKSFLTLESGFFGFHHIKYTLRDSGDISDGDNSEEINYKNLGDSDSFFIGDFFRIGGGKALRDWLLVGLSGGLGFYSPSGWETIAFSLTPFVELTLPEKKIRPFLRTGAAMNFYHIGQTDDDDFALDFLIGKAVIAPGMRFFISDSISLEATVGLAIGGGAQFC